jgi:hypothetical protein
MDYAGKVVIAAAYEKCEPFGKSAALVKVSKPASDNAQYIVIDRNGKQIMKDGYYHADASGYSMLGNLNNIPGLTLVAKSTGPFAYRYGLFDVDAGREAFAPSYAIIGALSPDRIVYAKEERPAGGQTSDASPFKNILAQSSLVGLMDRSGKVLVEPAKYVQFSLDKSGRYIRASNSSGEALLDMNGKTLVESEWDKLVIDEAKGAVFGYDVAFVDGGEQKYLRAAYDLTGKKLFAIKRSACGAELLVNAAGNPVWPKNGKPACPSENNDTDAKS